MTSPAPSVVLGADIPDALRGLARRLADDPPADLVILRPGATIADAALQDMATRPGTVTATAAGAPTPVATGFGQILSVDWSAVSPGPAAVGAVGWLRIAPADRRTAAGILRRAADQLSEAPQPVGDAFAWVLRALVRGGIVVRAIDIDPYPWSVDGAPPRSPDPEEVERIRLLRANRAGDSGYSVAVLRRLSKPLTSLAVRRGWAPNLITLVSLVIGLLAAGSFAQGSRAALLLGAVLLQVSLVVDCSDGEVARMTGRFSRTGAWLDAVTDRIKEFAAYIGLAIGSGVAAMWWIAGALIVLQTVRHLSDYTFEEVQRGWAAVDARGPLLAPGGPAPDAPPSGGGSATTMARRALFLPIGERWLVLSLAAVVLGAQAALWLMLGVGLLSLAYATLGRAVRTRRWTGGPVATALIVRQLDTAPFGLRVPLGGHSGALLLTAATLGVAGVVALVAILPLPAGVLVVLAAVAVTGVRAALFRPAWAAPAGLAALEMVPWLVGGVILSPDAGPAVVAVVFAVSFHRYDLLYRAMAGDSMPRWLAALSLGVPIRMLVLGAALVVTAAPGGVALPFAVYLGLVVVVVASVQWLASDPVTRQREGSPS